MDGESRRYPREDLRLGDLRLGDLRLGK